MFVSSRFFNIQKTNYLTWIPRYSKHKENENWAFFQIKIRISGCLLVYLVLNDYFVYNALYCSAAMKSEVGLHGFSWWTIYCNYSHMCNLEKRVNQLWFLITDNIYRGVQCVDRVSYCIFPYKRPDRHANFCGLFLTSMLGAAVVKLLAYFSRGPGFDSRSRACCCDFRDWLSPAYKLQYVWNTA